MTRHPSLFTVLSFFVSTPAGTLILGGVGKVTMSGPWLNFEVIETEDGLKGGCATSALSLSSSRMAGGTSELAGENPNRNKPETARSQVFSKTL